MWKDVQVILSNNNNVFKLQSYCFQLERAIAKGNLFANDVITLILIQKVILFLFYYERYEMSSIKTVNGIILNSLTLVAQSHVLLL